MFSERNRFGIHAGVDIGIFRLTGAALSIHSLTESFVLTFLLNISEAVDDKLNKIDDAGAADSERHDEACRLRLGPDVGKAQEASDTDGNDEAHGVTFPRSDDGRRVRLL